MGEGAGLGLRGRGPDPGLLVLDASRPEAEANMPSFLDIDLDIGYSSLHAQWHVVCGFFGSFFSQNVSHASCCGLCVCV